jgi:RNA polymerase-interacting CarD/CdnL/TRCF family regulator
MRHFQSEQDRQKGKRPIMDFHVGDKVIHWTYGLGEIVQLDEKVLAGHNTRCYVVQIRDLTLWVPINQAGQCSLRIPTPGSEFEELFGILRSPSEPLSNDRNERRMQLLEKIKDGKIEAICRVIRDLSFYRRTKKLNDNDETILKRAQNFLLTEWNLAFAVSLAQAELELKQLLGG